MEAHMDDDMLDLADRLCTVAGMLMEDGSVLAITTAKLDRPTKAARIAELEASVDNMRVLLTAAQILVRLG